MGTGTPLFPESASTLATRVDALFFYLLAIAIFFSLLIAGLIVYYAVRFKRRSPEEVGSHIHGGMALELTWTFIPFVIVMTIFVWGASVYFAMARPPDETLNIYVVGKQWMWKFQHLDGQREINELHVPVGRPVKLIMGSEDVIHSFYIPAFRTKADVIPGRYNTMWFTATKPGTYHLFCAEYCGTKHSGMIGSIVAMEPPDFEAWLGGGKSEESPVAAGAKLFSDLACISCHQRTGGRGPSLANVFGHEVELQGGAKVMADEAYIRESILNPQAKVVNGFQPIMPTFQGLITEEQLLQLIAYVRSLSEPGAATSGPAAPQGK
jgi:cytochrome c oxidase subunit 2